MRQFAADGAAAQNHQPTWQRGQAPDGVTGQKPRFLQTGNGRDERAGAGRDHDVTGGQHLCAAIGLGHLHRPRAGDAGMSLHDLDAKARVALNGVVRLDVANHPVNALHDGRKIHRALRTAQPERFCATQMLHRLGRANEGLARHAAVVQAITAHLVAFDQGHLGLDGRGDVGRHQTTRARTDHHQIAVEVARAWPTGVELALLPPRNAPFGDQGEHAQQGQAAQQCRRQDIGGRFDGRQLGPRVHVHHRAGQHADLADQIERLGPDLGQPHEQVDEPEWEHRHQAQGEQVEHPILGQPGIDGRQKLPQPRLHHVAQQGAGDPKCQQGSQAGGKGHHHQACAESE